MTAATTVRRALPALALAAALAAAVPAGAVVPHEVAIARGIQLIGEGKYGEALARLEEALAAAPANGEALFYAGVARSRLGQYEGAEELLRRALAESETAEVFYELGRVAALTGRCDDAERLLSRSAALGGGAPGPADGARLLEGCRGTQGRRLRAALSLGWQHDSNVVLDPDDPVAPAARQADTRAVALVALGGTLLQASELQLDASYSLYASRHADLEDYDAVHHRLSPSLAWIGSPALRPTVGYVFEHTSFGGDTYGAVHTGFARVRVPEGAHHATEAGFEYRGSRFESSDLFSDNADRRGTGWSATLRQECERGGAQARLFVALDRDDAREGWWDARGWRAGASAQWRPVQELALGANAEYRTVDYDDPRPGAGEAREDRVAQLGASLTFSPWRHGSLTLTANRTRDDSNLDAYTYRRTIYGLVVTLGI